MVGAEKLIRSSCRHLCLASLMAGKTEPDRQDIETVRGFSTSSLLREAAMLVTASDRSNTEGALAGGARRSRNG